ncbi:unnamed protein product [Cochlearia groenlandica]
MCFIPHVSALYALSCTDRQAGARIRTCRVPDVVVISFITLSSSSYHFYLSSNAYLLSLITSHFLPYHVALSILASHGLMLPYQYFTAKFDVVHIFSTLTLKLRCLRMAKIGTSYLASLKP